MRGCKPIGEVYRRSMSHRRPIKVYRNDHFVAEYALRRRALGHSSDNLFAGTTRRTPIVTTAASALRTTLTAATAPKCADVVRTIRPTMHVDHPGGGCHTSGMRIPGIRTTRTPEPVDDQDLARATHRHPRAITGEGAAHSPSTPTAAVRSLSFSTPATFAPFRAIPCDSARAPTRLS
jgi:hypothetical protein